MVIRKMLVMISFCLLVLNTSGCNLFETDGEYQDQASGEYSQNLEGAIVDDEKNTSDESRNDLGGSSEGSKQQKDGDSEPVIKSIVNPDADILLERFSSPEGFERISVEDGTFEAYLRNLPLKLHGSPVKYYDGTIKAYDVHEAVIDIDVGERDLQQCADAVMRLRAEYLYGEGLYDKIHFNFTNGFNADYSTWMKGNRISVDGNKSYWVKKTNTSNEYSSFRQYMDMVFAYAGTLSLSKELKGVDVADIGIGDVFMKGDLPGHCVIVVDVAKNDTTGEKIFMIAQSYMPAQDIHILKNSTDSLISPWYRSDFGEVLITPQWTFYKNQLMRFEE